MIHFNWPSLSDDEFEEFCTELMRRTGFHNVRRMGGPGGGDRGRDIHAEENLTSASGGTITTTILAQCKNYAGSRRTIGPADVEALAQRARTLHYNRILIITSYDLSAQAKQTAHDMATNPAWSIIAEWWTGYDLANSLMRTPDLKRQYELDVVSPTKVEIGVLNGYATNPRTEHRCTPTFSAVPQEYWSCLMSADDVNISYIMASEIDNRFDAIINPFGETFPEENWAEKKSYKRILEYIKKGGLFVNVAGFPFFYYWDPVGNRSIPSGRLRPFLDPATGRVLEFILFEDTLLYSDFSVQVDVSSPRQVTLTQETDDCRYVGDLLAIGISSVREFRAILAGNLNTIPLVRADGIDVFPLSAVRLGAGHLLVCGLDLHEEQSPIIALAVRNWILTAGGQLPFPDV